MTTKCNKVQMLGLIIMIYSNPHAQHYIIKYQVNDQGPLSLTWFNFNPSMDK